SGPGKGRGAARTTDSDAPPRVVRPDDPDRVHVTRRADGVSRGGIAVRRARPREDAPMPLGLVHFDPDAFPPEPTPCLRCGTETMLRFAGPCPACVTELREKFQGVGRAVSDEYV